MPLDDLMALLQSTTKALAKQHEEVALDQAAYHRQFWTHWQKLPEEMSIAAMNRDCEMVCRVQTEALILSQSIREGMIAKQTAIMAILAARSA
jgi:hypothetical protein